jgi:bifunctional DNA-binding transcriptional regulator/antitoxin component of YhaV-PrlF toxin-antitoxin module
MNTTIQISARGAMTLPKQLRKALGVEKGGVVMANAGKDGIALHPAVAFPIEMYSDDRIAEFDQAEAELADHVTRKRA